MSVYFKSYQSAGIRIISFQVDLNIEREGDTFYATGDFEVSNMTGLWSATKESNFLSDDLMTAYEYLKKFPLMNMQIKTKIGDKYLRWVQSSSWSRISEKIFSDQSLSVFISLLCCSASSDKYFSDKRLYCREKSRNLCMLPAKILPSNILSRHNVCYYCCYDYNVLHVFFIMFISILRLRFPKN